MNTKLIREFWHGNSLFRSLMHQELIGLSIGGTVVDVGSGKKKSYAHRIFHHTQMNLKTVDQKGTEDTPPVDMEKDALPFANEGADYVLLFNILEHLFHYDHALNETYRVLRPGGKGIGFVPFFCHYHPGPRDFFRYTHEALELMFHNAGFAKEAIVITPLGFGPFSSGFHLVFLAFPKIWRKRLRLLFVLALIPMLLSDKLLRLWQKDVVRDFPLGYKFIITKQ